MTTSTSEPPVAMTAELPVFVAQTSPLNPPAGPDPASEPFVFPSAAFNLGQVARQLARAREAGAGVCVLPEYGLQGIIPDHSAYALAAPHLLVALQALCQRHQLALVTTLVEPHRPGGSDDESSSTSPATPFVFASDGLTLEPVESSLRASWATYAAKRVEAGFESVNSAYYISAEGEIIGRYEKANLWHPERDYLRPGSEPSAVFDTPWGKAGLVICWDLSHPEAVQSLVQRGAEIIFAPTYWLSTDSDPIQRKYTPKAPLYDHALLPNLAFIRAFEAECLLVMANPGVGSATDLLSSGPAHGSAAAALEQWGRALVGRDNTYDRGFFGQSGVWAPLAGKMADVGINEGACDARLSFEVIRDARNTYRIVEEAHMRAKAKRDEPLAPEAVS